MLDRAIYTDSFNIDIRNGTQRLITILFKTIRVLKDIPLAKIRATIDAGY